MNRLESTDPHNVRIPHRRERSFFKKLRKFLLGDQILFMSKAYDAFISHAVEDKIEVTNDLNEMLVNRGLKIWYSGNELMVGESISEGILSGLEKSNFGIIVLSHNYFRKEWTKHELALLRNNKTKLFPIWHNISPEEIAAYDQDLADLWGLSTDMGLDALADELAGRIRKDVVLKNASRKKKGRRSLALLVLAMALFGSLTWIFRCEIFHTHPGNPCLPDGDPADRIGAVCADCWNSTAKGKGACAAHGGVKEWRCE